MKRIIFALFFLLIIVNQGFSQKFAFIDTEYILSKIPEYKTAQEQLDLMSKEYQKEVEAIYAEVDKMFKDYQAEKVLLSEDMKRKKEDAIIEKEKKAKELQQKYFGQNGELYLKRQELIKPIQDKIYDAVKEIAEAGSFSMIVDLAAGATVMYSDPKFDKSDAVLKKMGYNE